MLPEDDGTVGRHALLLTQCHFLDSVRTVVLGETLRHKIVCPIGAVQIVAPTYLEIGSFYRQSILGK